MRREKFIHVNTQKAPKSHTRVKVIVLKYYFGKSESQPYEHNSSLGKKCIFWQ